MRITQTGQMERSGTDYLIPVTITIGLLESSLAGLFTRKRTTRLFVTGQRENTNVVAEDGKFVNIEVRNWAVSLVNQDVMKRRVRRQEWEK